MDTFLRFFLRRIGFVFGLLLFGLLGACDDVTVLSAEEFVKKAAEKYDEGALPASVIQLKNALQKDPNNAPARLLLGRIYLDYGDSARAEKELLRARDLGADKAAVTLPLGRAWLDQGDFKKISQNIKVDEAAPPALKAIKFVLQGSAHAGLENWPEAETAFNKALVVEPGNALALVGLARVATVQGKNAQADTALRDALKAAPKDPDVLMLKGDLALNRSEYGVAVTTYQDIVDIQRFNFFHRIRLAHAQIAAGKVDEAIANVDKVLKRAPKHPGALYLKALAAFHSKDYKSADIHSKEVLAIVPNHLASQLLAGAANYALGQFEQASRYLVGFLADAPSHDLARRLYGSTLVNLGRGDDAILALQPLLDRSDDDALLLALIGTAALQNRDYKSGRAYFEKAARLQPEDAATRAQLGAIEIGLGNLRKGVEELEKAVDLDPTSDRAAFSLFTVHMREKQYDRAIEVGKRIQENRPKNPLGFTLAGVAHVAKGEVPEARAAYSKALELQPGVPDASLNFAVLEMRSKNAGRARTILEEALQHNPKNILILMRLGALEASLEKWDDAKTWVERAVEVAPQAFEPKVILARLHLRAGQAEKALNFAQGVQHDHPNNPDLLTIIGRAQLAAGLTTEAAATFRSLVIAQPDSVEAHFLLATTYRELKDWSRYKEQLEKAAVLRPENAAIRGELGALEVGFGNLEQGIKDLEKAIELDPKYDRGAFELFAAHMQARRHDQALEIAKLVQKNQPANTLGFTLAGMAHAANGELAKARAAFGKALEIKPLNPVATINLAALEVQSGNTDRAREMLEEALKHNPKNIPILLRLAFMDAQRGQWEVARSWVDKALEADPNALEPTTVLARLYLKSGDPVKALDVARRALQKRPNDPNLLEIAGRAQLNAGRPVDAVKTLRSLVKLLPKSSLETRYLLATAYRRSNDLIRYREELERIIRRDASQIRAKIRLANLLSEQGELERAIVLLDEMKKSESGNVGVIELDGYIALQQNRISDALQLFKKAIQKQPSSRLTRRLARIQWKAGDRDDGLATLITWLEHHPDDTSARMMLGGFYLVLDRLDAARSNFTAVVKMQPKNWAARNELAWVLLREGNPKAALPHAERALELANNNPFVQDTAGLIFIELGETERAIKLLRRASELLQNRPDIHFHLAQALAKGGDKRGARNVLQNILSGKTEFSERKEAEALLKELGG